MRRLLLLAAATLPAGCAPQGGFGVAQRDGVWWLTEPAGGRFFSLGVNVLDPAEKDAVRGPKYDGLREHGGDVRLWSRQTLARLDEWGFNTIGAWSSLRGRPYVLEFSLSYSWADVFDEQFEARVREAAEAALRRPDIAAGFAKLDADPQFIGYFTDNELAWGWGYQWSGRPDSDSLFEYYATLEPDQPGKQAWARHLAGEYGGDRNRLSQVWNIGPAGLAELERVKSIAPRSPEHNAEAERIAEAFLRLVAERYFSVTARVMRRLLPHRLNLGCRLTPRFPDVVAEVAGRYADVLSFNMYSRDLDEFRREATRLHAVGKRPVLVSEFAFPARANRSENRNRGYERAEVADDRERGLYYARFVDMLSELPFVVGCHWFQYFDEPPGGRADGESVNFGLVDIRNRPYADLVGSVADANARAAARHAAGKPCSSALVDGAFPPASVVAPK